MVIATKVRYQMDSSNVNKIGLSRRHIVESCQESLERLKTHYIDIYQVRVKNNTYHMTSRLGVK